MEPIPPDALYRQLMNRLRADILDGRYGVSGRLPTEFELCEIYGLSRTPVARALHDLAAEGVVLRHRRRGTFVNPEWLGTQGAAQPALHLLGPGAAWAAQVRDLVPAEIQLEIESPQLSDVHDIFRQRVAEGSGPDLVIVDSVWVAEFARTHFLTPLSNLDTDGWLAMALEQELLPPFADAFRHNGDVVAVPALVDVTGLWYVRSAVTRPPATWSELRNTGLSLAGDGAWEYPLTLPGGVTGAEATTYALVALLASNDAGVLGEAGVTLDSPAAMEAMAFLRQLVDEGVVPAQAVKFAGHEGVQLFAEGRAAMCVGASYQAKDIAAWAGVPFDQVLNRFGFAPLPRGPRTGSGTSGVLAGGMAYAIPRQAPHPKLAMSLLRRLTSTDLLVRQCLRTGLLPPSKSALEAVSAASPFHAVTGAMLEHAILRPVSPDYALVSDQLQAMVSDVITRRLRPAAAVSRAAETISAITRVPQALVPHPARRL